MADIMEEQIAPPPTEEQVTAARTAIGKYADFMARLMMGTNDRAEFVKVGMPLKDMLKKRAERLSDMINALCAIDDPQKNVLHADYQKHLKDGIAALDAIADDRKIDFSGLQMSATEFNAALTEVTQLVAAAGGITLSREGRPR